MRGHVLQPDQFRVNEAWIVFQLNKDPILTEGDGSFNCIALMDAASCFILANWLIPAASPDLTQLEARRLLKQAWTHKKAYPAKFLVPPGPFQTALSSELKRYGAAVVPVKKSQIRSFVGEAQQGFRQYAARDADEA